MLISQFKHTALRLHEESKTKAHDTSKHELQNDTALSSLKAHPAGTFCSEHHAGTGWLVDSTAHSSLNGKAESIEDKTGKSAVYGIALETPSGNILGQVAQMLKMSPAHSGHNWGQAVKMLENAFWSYPVGSK